MVGGTRDCPFDTDAAGVIFHILQRKLADDRHAAITEYVEKARRKKPRRVAGERPEPGSPQEQLELPLRDAFSRSANDAVDKLARGTFDEQGRPVDAEAMTLRANTKAVDFAATRAGDLIKDIDATTHDAVRDVMREGIGLHWDVDKIADRLEETGAFNDYRAEMIARTEVSAAMHAGMIEAGRQAKEADKTVCKRWVLGDDPCPICEENDDEVVELDDSFSSGDDAPPVHPNCECEIELFEPETDEEEE